MKVTKYVVLNLALVLSLMGNFSFAYGQTPTSERTYEIGRLIF